MIMKIVFFLIGFLSGTIFHILSYEHRYKELARMAADAERVCDAAIKALEDLKDAQQESEEAFEMFMRRLG